MHRQHAARRQQVVHHPEDRFLDLAGIVAAAHQDHLPGEIDQDADLAVGAVSIGVGMETGRLDDGVFRLEVAEIFILRLDEHVAREQRMPGVFSDDADRQAKFRVGAGIAVLDESLAALEVVSQAFMDGFELVLADWLIDRPPPDIVLAGGLLDGEFVGRRAAGIFAGLGD